MIRAILRIVLAAFYGVAGVFHIIRPEPFLTVMPPMVPFPEQVVFWTGIAEIAGAIGLVQRFDMRLRRVAGVGLALYALAVWPANINHFVIDMARADGGLGLVYHVPRMFAQPLLIAWALWAGEVSIMRRGTS